MRQEGILCDRDELREGAVRLTRALYRVSERFPEQETLRRHCREYADEILAGVVEWDEKEKRDRIAGKIDTLREWLLVAFAMQWVAPVNIEVLIREYTLLRDCVEQKILWEPRELAREQADMLESIDVPVMPSASAAPAPTAQKPAARVEKKSAHVSDEQNDTRAVPVVRREPNPRQQKILRHIAQAKQAKISDFFPVLAGVSSKTIQRDLSELVDKNFLRKEGEKRWTVYSLNHVL